MVHFLSFIKVFFYTFSLMTFCRACVLYQTIQAAKFSESVSGELIEILKHVFSCAMKSQLIYTFI